MSRRLRIGLPLSAAALVFASLGTASAFRAHSEVEARHDAQVARHAALVELGRARALGVPSQLTTALSRHFERIVATVQPSTAAPWDDPRAALYRRQTAAYRALRAQVDHTVTVALSTARTQATQSYSRAVRQLRVASALEIPARGAQSALARADMTIRGAGTVRQFDEVTASLARASARLRPLIARRRGRIAALMATAGGRRFALEARARDILTAESGRLSLLELFSPSATAYRADLQHGLQRALDAPTLASAALRISELVDLQQTIDDAVSRKVPAQVILVSTESQSVVMYQDARQIYSAPVTTGGPELPTDHGIFHIYFKASPFVFHSPWPPSSPYYYNPTPISFWMPFDGAEGLHDASWRSNFGPGSNLAPTDLGTGNTILGTHGCVNLPYDAAQFVWNWAPVGTTVVVV